MDIPEPEIERTETRRSWIVRMGEGKIVLSLAAILTLEQVAGIVEFSKRIYAEFISGPGGHLSGIFRINGKGVVRVRVVTDQYRGVNDVERDVDSSADYGLPPLPIKDGRSPSTIRKEAQLGMNPGTAMNRLSKMIRFHLIKQLNLDICYRCKERIENIAQLSTDHKEPWLNSADPKGLFFDMENIAFSHSDCNSGNARSDRAIHSPAGMSWCHDCQANLPVDQFDKGVRSNTRASTGMKRYCKACTKSRTARRYSWKVWCRGCQQLLSNETFPQDWDICKGCADSEKEEYGEDKVYRYVRVDGVMCDEVLYKRELEDKKGE